MMRPAVIFFVLVAAAARVWAGHDKTDVATTHDGSTYVGEIKSVQYATLTLDTHAAGLLSIDWYHVTGLTSGFEYRVVLKSGEQHFGSLGPSEEPGQLSIVGPSGSTEVGLADIFQIAPVEKRFWKRLDGSVNFGLTYTQASESFQYNLGGDTTYRTREFYATLSGQSILNTQADSEATGQHNLTFVLAHTAANKRWGTFGLGGLEVNTDQGYDLRSLLGGGAARFFISSSSKLLMMNLGVVYNREDVTDSSEVNDSGEALVGVTFRRFKRGSHSPSVNLGLQTFSNLTDGDNRVRAVFTFDVGWKIVGDFKVSLQVTDRYDSEPPGTDSKNNDLSLVTSIGYTY